MIDTLDVLKAQERELRRQICVLEGELRDVRVAIQAIVARRSPTRQISHPGTDDRPSMRIDDAIIQAVRNNAGTPKDIHRFLIVELGIKTTRNSVGTRLGKLKKKCLVGHDGDRWIIPTDGSYGECRRRAPILSSVEHSEVISAEHLWPSTIAVDDAEDCG